MSQHQAPSLSPVNFYSTPEHNCSYLPEEQAITVFVDPGAPSKSNLYGQLTRHGFRRSGEHIYRPHCQNCQQCIAVRVPAANFRPSRSQKRVLKNNADLKVTIETARIDDEHYALYERYIAGKHSDGDMHPASEEQYEKFLLSSWSKTFFIEFRDQNNTLISVAVVDELDDGFSAVYTYYDPDQPKRSLGKLAILWQLNHLKSTSLNYLYLGYYIKHCEKMNYKTQYRPLQILVENRWVVMN